MTAEPARVISVRNPWAWRIGTGRQVLVKQTWKPSWRGVLWIHARKDSDLSAPAELWPPSGQLVNSAIIGHVTLADVDGRPGVWRWILTDPRQLARPVTWCTGILACGSPTCRQGFPLAGTPPGRPGSPIP